MTLFGFQTKTDTYAWRVTSDFLTLVPAALHFYFANPPLLVYLPHLPFSDIPGLIIALT